jgi:hypothetical protein
MIKKLTSTQYGIINPVYATAPTQPQVFALGELGISISYNRNTGAITFNFNDVNGGAQARKFAGMWQAISNSTMTSSYKGSFDYLAGGVNTITITQSASTIIMRIEIYFEAFNGRQSGLLRLFVNRTSSTLTSSDNGRIIWEYIE